MKQQGRPTERFAEGNAGRNGKNDSEHHDDKAELKRPLESCTNVDDARSGEHLAEPLKGNTVHGKGQATIRPLKREDVDRKHRPVEEQGVGGQTGTGKKKGQPTV